MPLDASDIKWDEELCRLLVDNSLQGLLILQDERIIFVNKAVSEVSGYTRDELQSLSLNDLIAIVYLDDQERIFRAIENLLAGNLPSVRQEFRIVRKDGAIRWVDTLASSIKYQDKPALHLAYLDVTERKRMEKELRKTRDYLENLIDYANAPIIVWNASFNITRFNHSFERLTGLEAQDVLGKSLEVLFPERTREESLAYIRRTQSGERWDAIEIPT